MLKKTVCLGLTAALLLISMAGCAKNEPSGSEMKTLPEIREEKENVSKLAEKYENLDLSETLFYVPEVDKLGGFSVDVTASFEERDKVLFEAAEWVVGETPKDSEIRCMNGFDWIPYSEAKNLTDKSELFTVQYRTDKIAMSLDYWGAIYYFFLDYENVPLTKMGSYAYIFQAQSEPVKRYNLLAGENADEVYELQGGEISVKDAVELMQSELEAMPFHMDNPQLVPKEANIYKLGDKYAINAVFYYEYNGVLLDHHFYSDNLEIEGIDFDYTKDYLVEDLSMARNNQIDQLVDVRLGTFKPTDESYDEFVSLESFLSMMSEKLTGRSEFVIDSVELLYGVDRVFPEGFEALTTEEQSAVHPLGLKSRPIWVAYLSHTGLQEARHMCVWADAITGELRLYDGMEAREH